MPVRLPGTDTLFDHQETPVYPLVDQISCIIHHYCGMLKTIYVTCPLLTLMCVVRKPSFDPLYHVMKMCMRSRRVVHPPSTRYFTDAVTAFELV